jgi:hypothetical protein
MKTLLGLSLLISLSVNSQIYERTGKNWGVYAGANYSFINSNISKKHELTYSTSIGLTRMLQNGVYPKLGYHYSEMPSVFRIGSSDIMPKLHSAEASILIDRNLFKLRKGVRVRGGCHYLSIGYILAPEYRYTFSNKIHKNNSLGELSVLTGLSFTHVKKSMSKKNKSRTTQYDIFIRNGFSPFYSLETNEEELNFKRFEIGVSIRKIRHGVYNFLP